jgi:hypothetical protein
MTVYRFRRVPADLLRILPQSLMGILPQSLMGILPQSLMGLSITASSSRLGTPLVTVAVGVGLEGRSSLFSRLPKYRREHDHQKEAAQPG